MENITYHPKPGLGFLPEPVTYSRSPERLVAGTVATSAIVVLAVLVILGEKRRDTE